MKRPNLTKNLTGLTHKRIGLVHDRSVHTHTILCNLYIIRQDRIVKNNVAATVVTCTSLVKKKVYYLWSGF